MMTVWIHRTASRGGRRCWGTTGLPDRLRYGVGMVCHRITAAAQTKRRDSCGATASSRPHSASVGAPQGAWESEPRIRAQLPRAGLVGPSPELLDGCYADRIPNRRRSVLPGIVVVHRYHLASVCHRATTDLASCPIRHHTQYANCYFVSGNTDVISM